MRDQHGTLKRLKSLQIEVTREADSQYIHDEEGKLLRDSSSDGGFLNSKPDKLDADIIGRIPPRPPALSIGAEPTEEEVTVALRRCVDGRREGGVSK